VNPILAAHVVDRADVRVTERGDVLASRSNRCFRSASAARILTATAEALLSMTMMKRLMFYLLLGQVCAVGPTALAQGPRTISLDSATVADLNVAFDAGLLTSEQLVDMCLARIRAYDRQGPSLRALITVNPKALDIARHLDVERKNKGRRSPLHGIPVVLKDNINTAELPTTAGSIALEGSVPPSDAFVAKRLREAGAIILGKANMSEFASGIARSSLGGQMKNPHDLTRTPLGSSGGSGISVAAA
jgi:amidase